MQKEDLSQQISNLLDNIERMNRQVKNNHYVKI